MVNGGVVDGLRIDHPDGLHDPAAYVQTLHERTGGCWVVVEKILEAEERLPDWSCAGSSGYDALHVVGGVFVDPAAESSLTSLCASLTGESSDFGAVAAQSKRHIVSRLLAAEVSRLVEVLLRIGREDLKLRDVTVGRGANGTGRSADRFSVTVRKSYRQGASDVAVSQVDSAVASEPLRNCRQHSSGGLPPEGLALGRRGRSPARRVPRAVPANLRSGDGQGGRGHRVYTLETGSSRSMRGWLAEHLWVQRERVQ